MDCNLKSSRNSEDPRIRSRVNILDYNLLSKSAIAADLYCGRQSARICSARRIFDGDVVRKRRTLSCLIRARIGEERERGVSSLTARNRLPIKT